MGLKSDGTITAAQIPSTQATDTEVATAVSDHAALADPHAGYLLESLFDAAGDLIQGSADNTPAKLTLGTAGQYVVPIAGALAWRTPASAQSFPSNPAATTSLTGVMMGLAGAFTPAFSGRVLIFVTGTGANSTANDGLTVAGRYGTGTAPVNAAANTGTSFGNGQTIDSPANAARSPFALIGVITGLAVGTAHWVDVLLTALTGGTASLTGLSVSVVEF